MYRPRKTKVVDRAVFAVAVVFVLHDFNPVFVFALARNLTEQDN